MKNVIISIAWRNVWRNKLRSLVIVAAIAVGIIGAITMNGFMTGLANQRVESIIDTEISDIQIHQPKYLLNQEIKYCLPNVKDIIKEIKKNPQVQEVSARIVSHAMATSASSGCGVSLYGIQPEIEKKISTIYKKIIQGVYLENGQNYPVVVSKNLLDKLNLDLGDKLIVTLTDTIGTITNGAFNIVGVYKTNDDNFDISHVYVKQSDLRKIILYPFDVSDEIAIKLVDNESADFVVNQLNQIFLSQIRQKKMIVQTWSQIAPADESMVQIMDYFSFLFLIIIFTALIFVIANVMLMVVMERKREFGMLMALGMNKKKIFKMILYETIFLSMIGGFVGVVLSAIIVQFFSVYGFNLSSVSSGMNSIGYDSVIYFSVKPLFYIVSLVLVVIVAVIAGIFPALKALKLEPAVAIRDQG